MNATPLTRRLKVLLVNPGLEAGAGERNLPAGLMALAAFLREEHEVTIRDWIHERWSDEELIAGIDENRYDLVGLTAMTWQIPHAYRLIAAIKKAAPDLPIIMGGLHASFMPQEVFDRTDTDFICNGEGEETFAELLRVHFTGGDLTRVAGLWLRDDRGKAFSTEVRPLIDVKTLPEPARDQVPIQDATDHGAMGAVMFSRGCWSNCDFCASPSFWRRKVRIRTVDQMVNEVVGIKETYGINAFGIQDDIFTSRKKPLLEFCARIKPLQITYTCLSRTDQMDEEKLIALKESGCVLLSYGVESGNQAILDQENKRQNLDKVREVFALHHKHRVPVCALMIIGHVGETEQSLQDTYNLISDIQPLWTLPQFMCPYPGSALHFEGIAERTGTLTSRDYRDYVNMDYPIYVPEALTPEVMLEWRQRIQSLNPVDPMQLAEDWVATYLHRESLEPV